MIEKYVSCNICINETKTHEDIKNESLYLVNSSSSEKCNGTCIMFIIRDSSEIKTK